MKFSVPVPPENLEDYVRSLLDEWRPQCLNCGYPPRPSPLPSLHELFDIPPLSPVSCCEDVLPFLNCESDESEGSTGVVTAVLDEGDIIDLTTPPVSPLPSYEPPTPHITEEMLQCLEEMPTFDENDEVQSSSSSFEHWRATLEPGVGYACLRCAFYQDHGEASICGLCYLKALSEGMCLSICFVVYYTRSVCMPYIWFLF